MNATSMVILDQISNLESILIMIHKEIPNTKYIHASTPSRSSVFFPNPHCALILMIRVYIYALFPGDLLHLVL